jgi:hypothetical protein
MPFIIAISSCLSLFSNTIELLELHHHYKVHCVPQFFIQQWKLLANQWKGTEVGSFV